MIVKNTYRIIAGSIALGSGIISSLLSGFEFYNPSDSAIWALMTLGSALIGLGLIKKNKP